jgi:hypothetical protein
MAHLKFIFDFTRESSEWFVSAFLKSELFWCFLPGCGFRVSLDFQLRTVYGGCFQQFSGVEKTCGFRNSSGSERLAQAEKV